MNVFFSIIIPTYNRAEFITATIQSVLNQTFADFEILVVDDGSTDPTEDIVSAISDKRVRYFKKENEERSIARNFGVKQALGNYVGFLDSDDKFYPDHLQKAYALVKSNEFPEVAHLGFEIINTTGKITARNKALDENIPKRMLDENILCVNTIFIRRDIALQFPFPHHHLAVISEDWCLFMKLIARFPVYYDNSVTCAILEHDQRSLRSIDPDKLIASTFIMFDELKKDPVFLKRFKNKVGYFFSNQLTFVSLVLALSKNRKYDSLKFLIQAVRYDAKVIVRKRFLAAIRHLV